MCAATHSAATHKNKICQIPLLSGIIITSVPKANSKDTNICLSTGIYRKNEVDGLELYGKIVGSLSNYLYSYILIILLAGAGIYFTIKTKGIQFRALKEAKKAELML